MNGSVSTAKPYSSVMNAYPLIDIGLYTGLLLIAVWISFYQPVHQNVIWQPIDIAIHNDDQPNFAEPGLNDADWERLAVSDLSHNPAITWVRVPVEIRAGQQPIPPYAIFLSGPFSADAYWNGHLIGTKGRPGISRESESPGPIDSVLYIPDDMATPGQHLLALRLSSHYLGYQASGLIHRLSVGSYQSDPRRQLRYYALPLILWGGFLLLAIQFARMYWSAGGHSTILLAAIACLVLLQLAAEVSRSLISYSYDWHLIRSTAIWALACLSGLSLALLTLKRMPSPWRIPLLLTAMLGVIAVTYINSGFDDKTTSSIKILALIPLLGGITALRQKPLDKILLAAGLLAATWYGIGILSNTVLLDSGLYFSNMVFLLLVWFWLSRGSEHIENPVKVESKLDYFSIKDTGRIKRIPKDKVLYIRAAGNYAELVCENGAVVLHHQRLGQIMESPPSGFVRVHRSNAINLKFIEGLRSREGSRYHAELAGGVSVPVSRYSIKELKQYFG